MSQCLPYILELVTPPVGRVITLGDMETYLRFCDPSEVGVIQDTIDAATEYVEKNSGKQLLTATYDLLLCGFPWSICLPKPPLQSVVSVTYVDTAGVTQTLAPSSYRVQSGTEHAKGYVIPEYGTCWPSTRGYDRDVTVRFTCGFVEDVPAALKQQIRMLAKHWFENRSAVACGSMSRAQLAYDALEQFTMHHEFI